MRYAAVCLALLVAGQLAWGQSAPQANAQTQPLPADVFFSNPDMDDAVLAPGGRWIALKIAKAGGRVALAVLDVDGVVEPRVAVQFTDVDIGTVYWVNDDWLVFDVEDTRLARGHILDGRGLFSVRRDGTEPRQLIHMRDSARRRSVPPTARSLSSDHGLLHVPSTQGDEVIVGEYQWDIHGDTSAVVPKRMNVTNGVVTSIAQGMPRNARLWVFDDSGTPRVAVVTQDGRESVHWRRHPGSTSGDDWLELANVPAMGATWWPIHVDMAGDLFATVIDAATGEQDLRRFDFAKRTPAAQAMLKTPGFDLLGSLVTEAGSGRLLGVHATTDAETTAWLDPRLQRLQQEIDRRLPDRVNRLSCSRCLAPGMTVLVHSSSDRHPGEYWVWRGEPDAPTIWRFIGKRYQRVDPQAMATVDFTRFKARDGRQIPVWLTTPANAVPGRKLPTVVMPHGGPWRRGGAWEWAPTAQFLASRGYLVIEPEFRGSTGFGEAHFRAGWKQWGQGMQDDLVDAVRWAASAGLADASRVCIAGAGYGGYAALMGLARDSDVYRCGIAWSAVTDLDLLLGGGWGAGMSEDSRRFRLPQLVGDPALPADADMLRAVSPVRLAKRIQAPVLLAHGEADSRVPLQHGKRMRAALQAAGRDPQWVLYEGEGHGWSLVKNRLDFARRVEQFLADNLR